MSNFIFIMATLSASLIAFFDVSLRITFLQWALFFCHYLQMRTAKHGTGLWKEIAIPQHYSLPFHLNPFSINQISSFAILHLQQKNIAPMWMDISLWFSTVAKATLGNIIRYKYAHFELLTHLRSNERINFESSCRLQRCLKIYRTLQLIQLTPTSVDSQKWFS